MFHDPNRPERGANARDAERHLDVGGAGDAPHDGYSRLSRRPRSRFYDERTSLERADNLEEMERSFKHNGY